MIRISRLTGYLALGVFFVLAGFSGIETSYSSEVAIDDKIISNQVKTQLVLELKTESLQIEVETRNGVVQLSGFVEKEETGQRAEELTRTVNGVKEVKNDLVVK